jgi:hypothetical protein
MDPRQLISLSEHVIIAFLFLLAAGSLSFSSVVKDINQC